ncbi:MAG TPA: PBP1A family penicillin-binding protein [Bryobacteraceae bacterium]|nr:PBP1A family penicillin-binding protein [Bryobacteraceae bacterium]
MAVKVQVPKKASAVRFFLRPGGKVLIAILALVITAGLGVFTYYYSYYSHRIEAKLAAGPYANTSMLFAAPRTLAVGDVAGPLEIAGELRHSGYSESRNNRMGYFALKPDEIDVYPGPDSYFKRDDGVIKFRAGKVARIISLADNTDRTEYTLEPELISNLFDKNREKRRLVKYEDIPPVLVHAVVSAEDKRFFQHSGFDPVRIIKSAYVDVKKGQNAQGASTLSMQLAGMLLLNRSDRSWRRKIPEVLITLHLEQKLSKEQIFEYYANQVPLGNRGSFGIRGFGEAAEVYFGKDVSQLTLPEAATLAGLIQQPSYINPYRWPDRAKVRRNIVLKQMWENKYIGEAELERASASPMTLAKGGGESAEAPYFVDLVNDQLLEKFPDYNFQSNTYRVYTTLDMNLQRDAAEAVRIGMEEVDQHMKNRKKRDPKYPDPQCALIALDPYTGEVRAAVGGRNYGASQLNRILAKRQPGSSFKPFVYTTALNSALSGGSQVLTPASMVQDEATTFWFDGKPYEPSNFEHKFYGAVTLRDAMAHSLNVATVKVAEEAGYGAVVDLARRAGLNMDIQPTPAVALGAYEVTPLEIAGAYTIFVNHGIYTRPHFINTIANGGGSQIYDSAPEHRTVLDPRVAFLMDQMLEEVVRSGTGASVWGRGINFPVAGKTGTSHDGWFAGFTSKLLCVVWVGFDDNRQLDLEGAKSALPVWTEFMKRAHEHREYRNVSDFEAPAGVVSVPIDPLSGQIATAACPKVRTEYFIEGSQPVELCKLHGGGATQVASWETTPGTRSGEAATPAQAVPSSQQRVVAVAPSATPDTEAPPEAQPKKKKGFFERLRGIFH